MPPLLFIFGQNHSLNILGISILWSKQRRRNGDRNGYF